MEVQQIIGKNRTGIATAKELTEEMVEGTHEFAPSSVGDGEEVAKVRTEAAHEAEPIGSIPRPATLKQAVSTAAKAIKGEKPTLLLDKLGERLAFERTGVRLYDAMLSKFDSYGSFEGGPSRAELEEIRQEELAHFHMVSNVISAMGGDPTALTPSADIQAVLSSGIPKVLTDPRTTLVQCLEGILTAELVDNAAWERLVELTDGAGEDAFSSLFNQAVLDEEKHLLSVRRWLAALQS